MSIRVSESVNPSLAIGLDEPERAFTPTQALELASWGMRYLPPTLSKLSRPGLEIITSDASAGNTPSFDQSLQLELIEDFRTEGVYMSPTLQEDRSARLSCKTELDELIGQWDFLRKDNAEAYYEDIAHEPIDASRLRAYVLLPVAAGQEDETLTKTIGEYARQDIAPEQWSLLLFVNTVNEKSALEDSDAVVQKTLQQINRLKSQYPHLPLRAFHKTYLEKPTMGELRAQLWDVALLELYNATADGSEPTHDIIGISHDADADHISPDYVRRMCEEADATPDRDMFTCRLGWTNVGNRNSDMNRILRYWDYIGETPRVRKAEVGASDANTAIRFSTYAAVGGFAVRSHIGELIDIRRRIAGQRSGATYRAVSELSAYHQIVGYVPDIRLKTNPRRIYQCMAAGFAPDYAWTSLPFRTGLDDVRRLDLRTISQLPIPGKKQEEILEDIDLLNLRGIDMATAQRLRSFGRQMLGLPTGHTWGP